MKDMLRVPWKSESRLILHKHSEHSSGNRGMQLYAGAEEAACAPVIHRGITACMQIGMLAAARAFPACWQAAHDTMV